MAINPVTLTPFIKLKGQLILNKIFDNLLNIYIKKKSNIEEIRNYNPPKYSKNDLIIANDSPPKYSEDEVKLDVNLHIGNVKIPLKEGMNIINLCVCALPFEHICISSNKEVDFQMLISHIKLEERIQCISLYKTYYWRDFMITCGCIYKNEKLKKKTEK